jgi:type I restriction enzyme, S subunit
MKQYTKMKDSGIEWIGEIPEEWEIRKISKSVNKITNGFVGPTRDILVDSGIRYLQSLHIKNGKIKFKKKFHVTKTWSEQHKKSILKEGDVLVVQTGGIGECATVPKKFEGCNCHALIIIEFKKELLDGVFVSNLLRSNYGLNIIESFKTGALLPHLEIGKLKDVFLTVPNIEEQKQIAEFLDSQTTKIDSEVEKNEKLVTLLQEKKQATINHAVTNGLDDSVLMKDSEVGWIGKIPEHWREPTISNLKHMNVIVDFQDGNHGELHPKGDDFSFQGRPFLTANQIDDAYNVDFKNCYKLPEEFCKKLRIGFSQANDILFCHNATVGRIGMMPNNAPDSIVGTSITYYRIDHKKLNRRFFVYLLDSDYISSQYEPIMKQSTRNQFSILKQAKLKTIFPTKEESDQIVFYLDKQTKQFDELISKAKLQIKTLQEYRQSLISSAVTGKIDVREAIA